jgi:uncharacterized protein YdcH (DUF465 family)
MADAQLRLDDNVRAVLLRTDEAFQQLASEHHDLDEQIRHLSTLSYLTERQQLEEVDLKKRKLAIKDRMTAMLRDRQFPGVPAVRTQ